VNVDNSRKLVEHSIGRAAGGDKPTGFFRRMRQFS